MCRPDPVNALIDPVKKARRREEVFPIDCQKAFDMGVRFATGGK